MEADGQYLRVGEVAKLLGVSGSTVRNWTKTGRLESYRTPGGHRLYRRADIEGVVKADIVRINPAAEILGVSMSTVRNWTDAGLLKTTRTFGGQRRYSRSELERFVESMRDRGREELL